MILVRVSTETLSVELLQLPFSYGHSSFSDTGSFRLGELARIARRQQLEEQEVERKRRLAQDAEDEKRRQAEEKLKEEEEKSAKHEKSGMLPGFFGGGFHTGSRDVEQLQTDVRIIERKVDDVISMIQRYFSQLEKN